MTRRPRKPKVDTWAEDHHAAALEFPRRSLSSALGPYLELMGQPGFPTDAEIMRELGAAMMLVDAIARETPQEVAP